MEISPENLDVFNFATLVTFQEHSFYRNLIRLVFVLSSVKPNKISHEISAAVFFTPDDYPVGAATSVLLRPTQIARPLAKRRFGAKSSKSLETIDALSRRLRRTRSLYRHRFYRFVFHFRRLGEFKFASNLSSKT